MYYDPRRHLQMNLPESFSRLKSKYPRFNFYHLLPLLNPLGFVDSVITSISVIIVCLCVVLLLVFFLLFFSPPLARRPPRLAEQHQVPMFRQKKGRLLDPRTKSPSKTDLTPPTASFRALQPLSLRSACVT